MLRGAGFVARTDLSNTIRQRETILWTFLMPIVFFYFIGTVTGNLGPSSSAAGPQPFVVQAPDNSGPVVTEIVRKLQAQEFDVDLRRDAGSEAPRLLVVPQPSSGKSFSDAVIAGEKQTLAYRSTTEGPGAELERVRVMRAVYGVLADLVVIRTQGATVDAGAFQAIQTARRLVTLEVSTAGRRVRAPTGFEQAIPGTMVMFTMLVTLMSGGILLVIERRLGLLRRLASAPISREAVVTGKWAGRLALAVVQIAFAMLAGTLLFKMAWGPTLPMILVLLLAWAAFNASLALFLGSVARSEGQMVGMGVLSTMVLAALGGCWWPIEITPRWMQSLAMFLPTGWAMDAMHRLVSFGDPWTAAIPHAVALALSALVIGAAGSRVFRFT